MIVKTLAVFSLLGFSAYTVYCVRSENFWNSLKKVFSLKWGLQVTLDLYIGLLLFSYFMYLNEGSVLIWLAWLIPTLILGNIVPLIYFLLNYAAIASRFL